MATYPHASVIILAYNGESYMASLLDSLLRQTYPAERMEILVADNGSADGTCRIVEQWPGVRLLRLNANLGFAQGNNEAARHANGEVLVFLNQDTICHPDWLLQLVSGLDEAQGVGAVESNMLLPGDPGFLDLDTVPAGLSITDASRLGGGKRRRFANMDAFCPRIVSGCSFALRRSTLERLGELFDARFFMYAEDTDLSLRLVNNGFKLAAVRHSVVHHLHGPAPDPGFRGMARAARAMRNRVIAFYKNMAGLEFLAYIPFLLLGGWTKIFSLSLPPARKVLYFFPFGVFSLLCMAAAFTVMPQYSACRRRTLQQRAAHGGGRFLILAHMLGRTLPGRCA